MLSYQAESLHPMREQESAVPCREIPFSFRESPALGPHSILSILGSAPILQFWRSQRLGLRHVALLTLSSLGIIVIAFGSGHVGLDPSEAEGLVELPLRK